MGNVVVSLFPLIIFILLCFNVLSTVPRENRLADFLYVHIYIYIYIYIKHYTIIVIASCTFQPFDPWKGLTSNFFLQCRPPPPTKSYIKVMRIKEMTTVKKSSIVKQILPVRTLVYRKQFVEYAYWC